MNVNKTEVSAFRESHYTYLFFQKKIKDSSKLEHSKLCIDILKEKIIPKNV
jgi:hypothetical protein